jgi:hypothetical protein
VSALEGNTTLPVVGTTKKSYVAVAVALTAGIVGWAWYKRVNGSDAAGGDTSYYADTRTGSELPTDAYTNPAPNADGQSGTGIGGDSVFHAPNTDPEWAQAAIEALSWYEPGFVSGIVGKYLGHQPLTTTEAAVIREAWAQIGRPPGNQTIVTATTGGTGNVVPPAAQLKIVNLRVTSLSQTGVKLDWSATGRPTQYRVYVDGALRLTTTSTAASLGHLARSRTYVIGVQPVLNNTSGPVTTIRATTKK